MGKKRKKGGYYNDEYFFKFVFGGEPPNQTVVEKELTDELFDRNYASHRNPSVQINNLLSESESSVKRDEIKNGEIEELILGSQSTTVQIEKESFEQEKEVKVHAKIQKEEEYGNNQEKPIEEVYTQWNDKNRNGDIGLNNGLPFKEKEIEDKRAKVRHDDIKENGINKQNENNENDGSVNFNKSVTEDEDINNNNQSDNDEINFEKKVEENNGANDILKQTHMFFEDKTDIIDKEDQNQNQANPIEEIDNQNGNQNEEKAINKNNKERDTTPYMIETSSELIQDITKTNEAIGLENNVREIIDQEKVNNASQTETQIEEIPNNIQNTNLNELRIDNINEIGIYQSWGSMQEMQQNNNNNSIQDNKSNLKLSTLETNNNYLQEQFPQNNIKENNLNEDIRVGNSLKTKNKPKQNERNNTNTNANDNEINIFTKPKETNTTNSLSNRNGKCHSMIIDGDYANVITMTEERNTKSYNHLHHSFPIQSNKDQYQKTEYHSTPNDILHNEVFISDKIPVISPPLNKDDQCCIII